MMILKISKKQKFTIDGREYRVIGYGSQGNYSHGTSPGHDPEIELEEVDTGEIVKIKMSGSLALHAESTLLQSIVFLTNG